MEPAGPAPSRDWPALVLIAAIAAFATPLRMLWLQPGAGWLAPFGVWAAIIVAAAIAVERRSPR